MNLLYTFLWVFGCAFSVVFGIAAGLIAGIRTYHAARHLSFLLRNSLGLSRNKFRNQ